MFEAKKKVEFAMRKAQACAKRLSDKGASLQQLRREANDNKLLIEGLIIERDREAKR